MKKPKLLETIIVEGKYDKIKLDSILDATIIVTHGFSVFTDAEKMSQIKLAGQKNGIIILTDSDRAGFQIRNYIKQYLPNEKVIQAYIPEIFGKEKRKNMPAKEGKIGVEGVNRATLMMVLKRAGCHFVGENAVERSSADFTKADLYMLGLLGNDKSASLREKVAKKLSLPCKMSSNALLDMINLLFETKEGFLTFLEELK